ncbi:hypothetical protein [Puia dinghuensis]|uniref:Uncharacterized protein n=1 Tax=Puia dinghuensis TaxID=1792502 RepID=A0A8J2XQW6_9BACT|nr:hypothetical protein [Puia dinghuensis]GGA96754.1 hypothetical protein GCM10011511_20060 [Puia dinghuensis]
MRYQYVVILKKHGERATDILSGLLCFFSALCFAFIGIRLFRINAVHGGNGNGWAFGGPSDAWLNIVVAAAMVLGLVVTGIARQRMPTNKVRYRYLLLLAAAGWMLLTPAPWVGALFFILTFLEYQTKRPLEIGFDHDRVVINTLIKQQFDWSVFNNVILKDGLLTLDFKNNRLIQKEVADDDDEDDADEEEFNTYCRTRLAAAQS